MIAVAVAAINVNCIDPDKKSSVCNNNVVVLLRLGRCVPRCITVPFLHGYAWRCGRNRNTYVQRTLRDENIDAQAGLLRFVGEIEANLCTNTIGNRFDDGEP